MTHRAAQILEAARALIAARVEPDGVDCFVHRRQSLSSAEDELPAVTVDFGEDEGSEDTTTEIYSELTVETTAVVVAALEEDVRAELLNLRREIHRALMASATAGLPYSITLGLSFVENVYYRGAAAPEIDSSAENHKGELTSRWAVLYTMDLDDPGDG